VGRTVLSNIQNIQVLNFDSLIAETNFSGAFSVGKHKGKTCKESHICYCTVCFDPDISIKTVILPITSSLGEGVS
jgi:hypothetical protein